MTTPEELLRTIGERLQTTATVKNVFGEPISAEGKTVIPVARIQYGFGAGAGRRDTGSLEQQRERSGGGGGGGIRAEPAGVLEITPAGTRFIQFFDIKRAALTVAAGFLLGMLFGGRQRNV